MLAPLCLYLALAATSHAASTVKQPPSSSSSSSSSSFSSSHFASASATRITATRIAGADPTGATDSSAALNAYIYAACAATNVNDNVAIGAAAVTGNVGSSSEGGGSGGSGVNGGGIRLGGLAAVPVDAVLDLAGGVYRMDAPLAINSTLNCSGKLYVRGGTLLAGPGLLAQATTNMSFLATVIDYWGGTGVSFEHVVFASNNIGGGLRVDAAHHVHVRGCQFFNFATYGIHGSKYVGMGHDLSIDNSRLTECTGGMAACADVRAKKATAILMEFPDSHFRNSVITCGLQGIVNRGGANTFRGLHIWTSCNPAARGDNLTLGFVDEAGTTRISDCQIDNCRLRVAGGRGTAISNTYFNSLARLELAPSPRASGSVNTSDPKCQYWREGAMCGLLVTGNHFGCPSPAAGPGAPCAQIDLLYQPSMARQVHVRGNAFENVTADMCTQRSYCNGVADCALLFQKGGTSDHCT